MIVICIEGCHGSGKTQLCKQFEEAGFTVLDEAFLDMPDYALHPQTLLMETSWVCSWFQRLLKHQMENKKSGRPEQVLIADRSPFSAVFYANNGHLLEPLIRHQMVEVYEAANIEIHSVLVSVDKEVLWGRIQQRLAREPERERYNEGDRDWMEKVVAFYNDMQWDLTVENNDVELTEVRAAVVSLVSGRSTGFKNIYKRLRDEQLVEDVTTGVVSDEELCPPKLKRERLRSSRMSPSSSRLVTPTTGSVGDIGGLGKALVCPSVSALVSGVSKGGAIIVGTPDMSMTDVAPSEPQCGGKVKARRVSLSEDERDDGESSSDDMSGVVVSGGDELLKKRLLNTPAAARKGGLVGSNLAHVVSNVGLVTPLRPSKMDGGKSSAAVLLMTGGQEVIAALTPTQCD